MSIWHFEKRDPAGVQIIPKDEEYFSSVSGIVTSLVRETTQNSGDAWAGRDPVKMHFRFGRLDANRFADYTSGLDSHLTNFPVQRKTLASGGKVPYLAIEDFGTHGLCGAYDLEAGVESSYVAFWRRYGESSKSEGAGGRHGLGKSTIYNASKLRLFFGATVRSDDPERHLLLQGQISLRPHRIGNDIFDAYGLWYDNSDGELRPFIDKAARRFIHDFNLRRCADPGLSVVIPFPDDDLTPDEIIKAVIENTFHQIITGDLIVEVNDTIINPSTIFRLADNAGLERLKAAMALSADVKQNGFPVFSPRPDTTEQRLKAEHFSDAEVRTLRERWASGEIVSVKLPVRVTKKQQKPQTGSVSLYVRREQKPEFRKETYVRGRVTVGLRPVANRTNCVALLVANADIVSTFLGDAEPPAHNHWYINRLRASYQNPRQPLQRILYSLRDLLDLLEDVKIDQPIKDAFLEYLYTIRREEEDNPGPRPKPTLTSESISFSIPPATVMPHRLQRIEGGFAYSYHPEGLEAGGADGARIVVSYRRRTGKKAPKSAKFRDFKNKLPVEETGSAELDQTVEPHRVTFVLRNVLPGYEMRVTGFDTNRDLELRLETVTA